MHLTISPWQQHDTENQFELTLGISCIVDALSHTKTSNTHTHTRSFSSPLHCNSPEKTITIHLVANFRHSIVGTCAFVGGTARCSTYSPLRFHSSRSKLTRHITYFRVSLTSCLFSVDRFCVWFDGISGRVVYVYVCIWVRLAIVRNNKRAGWNNSMTSTLTLIQLCAT